MNLHKDISGGRDSNIHEFDGILPATISSRIARFGVQMVY
jgi:hypothetical protein